MKGRQKWSLKKLLETFTKKKALNLILTVGAPPMLKTEGNLEAIGKQALSSEEILELVSQLLTPKQKELFEKGKDLDISFGILGMSRFRGNIFYQRGAANAVFTLIPFEIPSWDQLNGPKNVLSVTNAVNGLIIVTGLPGSGKTTVMSALIDHINTTRAGHIITLEKPIEYLFRHKKSITSQRQIGSDVDTWASALSSVFRQSPDVVALSEVRSLENIEAALNIAATCSLCIILMHAPNTVDALRQIIGIFPAEKREYIRNMLSDHFLCAIASRLFTKKQGKGRLSAYEVLQNNTKVSRLIEKGNFAQLKQYLKPSLKSSITKLKKEGKI